MTWIAAIPCDASEGRLGTLYDRVQGPDNTVDDIILGLSPNDGSDPDNWNHS